MLGYILLKTVYWGSKMTADHLIGTLANNATRHARQSQGFSEKETIEKAKELAMKGIEDVKRKPARTAISVLTGYGQAKIIFKGGAFLVKKAMSEPWTRGDCGAVYGYGGTSYR